VPARGRIWGRRAAGACALFLLATLAGTGRTTAEDRGTLIVEVTDLRSDRGQLLLRLFDRETGFPTDGARALRQLRSPIAGGRVRLELADLPFGAFAIACVHDENGNGKLDTNFLGIPKEGVCASNDARGRRGPPKWKDARFELRPGGATVRIHMSY
jgi:uncharacterized protein (DUF2141 family)